MQSFWSLYLKVIVIMNCLEIQPLLENFLRILNITQSTSGMLRLSLWFVSWKLAATLSTPRKASGVREIKWVPISWGMISHVCRIPDARSETFPVHSEWKIRQWAGRWQRLHVSLSRFWGAAVSWVLRPRKKQESGDWVEGGWCRRPTPMHIPRDRPSGAGRGRRPSPGRGS